MKSREEILQLLKEAREELVRDYNIRHLALFGSYARGEQGEDSDVDILVEVDPSIGLRFVELAERLEELLGVHVELVSTRAIKPRNWKMIKKDLVDVR
jgi:predicted nucleotidyltransferase